MRLGRLPHAYAFHRPMLSFSLCRVHVVYIIRFVTRGGQDVDVGQSVCVSKSLDDV
jgi:hypothetical protein